jgi:Na+-transporting NADH:ubiquinone oxidoreductase subunit NqrE
MSINILEIETNDVIIKNINLSFFIMMCIDLSRKKP